MVEILYSSHLTILLAISLYCLQYCLSIYDDTSGSCMQPRAKRFGRHWGRFSSLTWSILQPLSTLQQMGCLSRGSLSGPDGSTARGLCFIRQRVMGSSLAQHLDCDFYHARLPASERASILTIWSHGRRSPFLIATSALGAGVDYPSVRRIIHVDAPEGLVAYGQETGRAGRDGLHAVCTVVLPSRWLVSWDHYYRTDFITEDIKYITWFLQTRHCLRQLLTGYLDGSLGGREGTACNGVDGIERVPC